VNGLQGLLRDLVIANHILAREGVVDGYGHVSVRHPDRPDRFFLSGSRSPELVSIDDIMEYDLDCRPIDQRGRAMYIERPIHGAIFNSRPDVQSVVHNHADAVIPFTVTKAVKLRPLIHTAAGIGEEIPVWDIREEFGDTDMLVRTLEQGADLAARLGDGNVVLMRGHGCAVASGSLYQAVQTSIYLKVNAEIQEKALRFGDITYLSQGEIAAIQRAEVGPESRTWEYWVRRSGP
jgi:ribulose-5-phosphate 4-epimerase/fuculose-1-phosphate aldolase